MKGRARIQNEQNACEKSKKRLPCVGPRPSLSRAATPTEGLGLRSWRREVVEN